MTTTINASNSGGGGLVQTADASGVLALQTAGTTAVTIDTSQNVGIGTTTPLSGYKLNVGSTSAVLSLEGAAVTLFTSGSLTSNVGGVLNFRPQLGTTINDIFNLSICAYDHSGDTNADGLSINGSDGVSFSTGSNSRNERMRIDSGGRVLINKTSNNGTSLVQMTSPASTDIILAQIGTNGGSAMAFLNAGGAAQVGNIVVNVSSTAYNTSSDYRLKEAIAPMTGALAKVALLKPVTYKWKVDGSDGQGFIAHELAEVVPGCVTGEKDAVTTYIDEDGNEATRPAYQGIDTSFLVATLAAAIQEQQALITSLTARIAALEGTPA